MPSFTPHHRDRPAGGRRGFTLLEVLIVVFILSAIAMSAVTLTDGMDQQYRFEDTRLRRDRVRSAVLFDASRQVAGKPLVSGFAADMGRLPNSLSELVQGGTLPVWQFDLTAGQWAGWRGPYVQADVEPTSGLKAFRDGWGNVDLVPSNDALYFGWNYAVDQAAGTLALQSFAADGVPDGSPGAGSGIYDADYPPPPADLLIDQYDHLVNLKGWEVWVEFRNDEGGKATLPKEVRLRLYYPREDGRGGFHWPVKKIPTADPQKDAAEYLSLKAKLNGELNAKETKTIRFQFSKGNVDKFIPAGIRTIVVLEEKKTETVYNPAGNNTPVPLAFVPQTTLPPSANQDPLIRWEAD